ncbi:hypothetical protein BJY59DRAFT_685803 [Rhodotorula toruloides]
MAVGSSLRVLTVWFAAGRRANAVVRGQTGSEGRVAIPLWPRATATGCSQLAQLTLCGLACLSSYFHRCKCPDPAPAAPRHAVEQTAKAVQTSMVLAQLAGSVLG